MTRSLRKAPRRFGPDIIHVSILIFLIAGTLTLFTRIETFVYLREGDTVELPGGERFTVNKTEALTYESGRPKDYLTTLELHSADNQARRLFTIEVNKPLKTGGYSVYQETFSRSPVVSLSTSEGETYDIGLYETRTIGGKEYAFVGFEVPAGTEDEYTGAIISVTLRDTRYRARVGGQVGELEVRTVWMENVTGLKIASDPGYGPMIAASVLLIIGLALTFVQKLTGRREQSVAGGEK